MELIPKGEQSQIYKARGRCFRRGPAYAKFWETLAGPSGLVTPLRFTRGNEEPIVQWGSLRAMLLEEMPVNARCERVGL